jgi:hypothetical protein
MVGGRGTVCGGGAVAAAGGGVVDVETVGDPLVGGALAALVVTVIVVVAASPHPAIALAPSAAQTSSVSRVDRWRTALRIPFSQRNPCSHAS